VSTKRENLRDGKIDQQRLAREQESTLRQIKSVQSRLETLESLLALFSANHIRRGSVSVIAGTNSVKFQTSMGTTSYILPKMLLFIDSLNEGTAQVNSKQKDGFTCYCSDAGTLDYLAIK